MPPLFPVIIQQLFALTCINFPLLQAVENYFSETFPNKCGDNFANNKKFASLFEDQDHISMGHPLFNFNIDTGLQLVENALLQTPSSRWKPVVCTVRGTGGGKTRALEELRIALNKRNGCVAVAVTFNKNTMLHIDETSGNKERALVKAVISRLASTLYSIELTDCIPILNGVPIEIKTEQLLPGFIRHVVKRMRENGARVTSFVILIDEAVRALEELNSSFDLYGQIRSGVLDTQILDGLSTGIKYNDFVPQR